MLIKYTHTYAEIHPHTDSGATPYILFRLELEADDGSLSLQAVTQPPPQIAYCVMRIAATYKYRYSAGISYIYYVHSDISCSY